MGESTGEGEEENTEESQLEEQDDVQALEETESEEDRDEEGEEEQLDFAAQMLKELDQDKDGKVNLKEFTDAYKVADPEEHHKGRAQDIESAFAKNDKDKDNKLDVHEFESADHDVLANQEQDLESAPPSVV